MKLTKVTIHNLKRFKEETFTLGVASLWQFLATMAKAIFEDDVWYHPRSVVSAPFVSGEKIAVKVFDDRGNELVVVKKASGGV